MNFAVQSLSTVPSCTKTVTIRTDGGDVIKLKQNREVTVNGEDVLLQPSVWIDGVAIRHASSVFVAGMIIFLSFLLMSYRFWGFIFRFDDTIAAGYNPIVLFLSILIFSCSSH